MKELIEIQRKLKAPKNQFNSFGKYKYRSAEDILEAVKPLTAEQGCILTLTDDIVSIDGRFYVKATAAITNGKGVTVSVNGWAREAETKSGMDASQITGSCSSYARKYALNGLFLIDDTKDADTDEQRKQAEGQAKKAATAKKEETSTVSKDQQLIILADIKTKTTREELKKLWDDCEALTKEKWFLDAITEQGKTINAKK